MLMDRNDVKIVSSTELVEVDAAAATRRRCGTRWRGWRRWSGSNDDSLGLR